MITEKTTVLPEYECLLKTAGLVRLKDFIDHSGGRMVCHKRGRSVCRIVIDRQAFFLKRNRIHWAEFWKTISRLNWPDLGSRREWMNIRAFGEIDLPTTIPVATGRKVWFGLEAVSFTLTAEIPGASPMSLLARQRKSGNGPWADVRQWRQQIREMAAMAGRLHRHGMYHQDFYLNHFFLDDEGQLFLLDLQRLRRRAKIPERFRVKDLGQLNYSARECGVSRTDRLRFFLGYLERSDFRASDRKLMRRILAKTERIARHDRKLRERRRRRGELC